MPGADAGVSSAATMDGTEDVDAFEKVFEHKGIVVKVLTSATSSGRILLLHSTK